MDSWASTSNLTQFAESVPGCRVLALLEVNSGILLGSSDDERLPGRMFELAARASRSLYPDQAEGLRHEEVDELVVQADDGLYVLSKLPSLSGLVLLASCAPGADRRSAVAAMRRVVARMEFGMDMARASEIPAAAPRVSGIRGLIGDDVAERKAKSS